jgi:hypothetical protein
VRYPFLVTLARSRWNQFNTKILASEVGLHLCRTDTQVPETLIIFYTKLESMLRLASTKLFTSDNYDFFMVADTEVWIEKTHGNHIKSVTGR